MLLLMVKSLYVWLGRFDSFTELRITGEITNSDWYFHQVADASAIIGLYTCARLSRFSPIV